MKVLFKLNPQKKNKKQKTFNKFFKISNLNLQIKFLSFLKESDSNNSDKLLNLGDSLGV